jgi:hypothetical protein
MHDRKVWAMQPPWLRRLGLSIQTWEMLPFKMSANTLAFVWTTKQFLSCLLLSSNVSILQLLGLDRSTSSDEYMKGECL